MEEKREEMGYGHMQGEVGGVDEKGGGGRSIHQPTYLDDSIGEAADRGDGFRPPFSSFSSFLYYYLLLFLLFFGREAGGG